AVAPVRGRASYADGRAFHGFVAVSAPNATAAALDRDAVPTDDAGRFEIAGLRDGTYAFTAFAPGELSAWVGGIGVPRAADVVIVVDAGARTVSGRVLDATSGEGIEGAALQNWASDLRNGLASLARSGKDGRFSILARGSEVDRVHVAADGYASVL